MKNTLIITLHIALLIISSQVAAAEGETLLDRIVAIVDGYPVLHSDVMEKVSKGPLVVVSEYPATEKSTPYEQALQDKINFELVMQEAHELELDVTEGEVEHEIEQFLKQRNLGKDGLLDFLSSQGTTYERYRSDFRDQMILRQFQGRVIKPSVKITDRDVETYYLKKSGTTAELIELTLRQIFIKVDENSTNDIIEGKQTLAADVYRKLADGLNFEEAVKLYSDGPGRETGGLMKGIKLTDLAGQIRSEVENLQLEQFCSPVRTSLGFHIFYLADKKFSGSDDFLKQKNRLEFELRNVELAAQTRKWLTEKRKKSKVDIIKD